MLKIKPKTWLLVIKKRVSNGNKKWDKLKINAIYSSTLII